MISKEKFEEIRTAVAQKNDCAAVETTIESVNVLCATKEETQQLMALLEDIPVEDCNTSPDLCFMLIQLKLLSGDVRGARRWHKALLTMRDKLDAKSQKRAILENRIICAGIAVPQEANTNLLLSLAILANEFGDAHFPLARLSATNRFPSVLRGGMDLSKWVPSYRAVASIVRPYLPFLLEDDADGVVEVAVAELLYEKNELNLAAIEVGGALNASNPEITFAGLALLARIGAVDTKAKSPWEILQHLEGQLIKQEADFLLPNLEALKARFDMLRGDLGKVQDWVSRCTANDLDGCYAVNYFELITKARAHIALGEYRAATTLCESLMRAMQDEYRPLDTIECLTLGAIACDRLGSEDVAINKLEKALLIAGEFGYIRVVADCGKPAFHLLARYVKKYEFLEELPAAFPKKLADAASSFSATWPALFDTVEAKDTQTPESYSVELGEELTQSELHILQLMDSGKKNSEIAKELYVQLSTVKFHISNLMKKLGASNRVETIKLARQRGLLP